MPRVIALIGKSGSGKSTIGRIIASRLGWRYVSTGDIARQIAEENPMSDIVVHGAFAPEREMRDRVLDILMASGDVVLDGMPRKPEQVDFLNEHADVTYVTIDVDDEVVVGRLGLRGRADDHMGSVLTKLYKYKRSAPKIVGRIIKTGHISRVVDGDRPPHDVADTIIELWQGS